MTTILPRYYYFFASLLVIGIIGSSLNSSPHQSLESILNYLVSIICNGPNQTNPSVFENDPLFKLIEPFFFKPLYVILVLISCLVSWLITKSLPNNGVFKRVVPILKAVIFTTAIITIIASILVIIFNQPTNNSTEQIQQCERMIGKITDFFSPSKVKHWVEPILNPLQNIFTPLELEEKIKEGQTPPLQDSTENENAIPSHYDISGAVLFSYQKTYSPLVFILELVKPFIMWIIFFFGLLFSIPSLNLRFEKYQTLISLLFAGTILLLLHQKDSTNEKLRIPTILDVEEYGMEYFATFSIFVSLPRLIRFVASFLSYKHLLVSIWLLWSRLHEIGLPYWGILPEMYVIVLLSIFLFKYANSSPGIFLMWCALSHISPSLLPENSYFEWYLFTILLYHFFVPQQKHSNTASPSTKPKKRKAE